VVVKLITRGPVHEREISLVDGLSRSENSVPGSSVLVRGSGPDRAGALRTQQMEQNRNWAVQIEALAAVSENERRTEKIKQRSSILRVGN
jgi:hypothetical protein